MSVPKSEMQPANADYSNIKEEDKPALKEWLDIKASIEEINKLPASKTASCRSRALEIFGKMAAFENLFEKYPFLSLEYFRITKTLTQYINAQEKPLEECATRYFKDLFSKTKRKIESIKFFSKSGGDQLGRKMRIKYTDEETKEEREIDYFIKTHQYGSKSGISSTKPLDPKELFIYKVLEYTGLGPTVHFMFNSLSQGGFYIATPDAAFAESKENQKDQVFMTLDSLKENIKDLDIKKMETVMREGFACTDILCRLFCLRDVITNSGNCGFVINKLDDKYKFQIVDFIVETQGNYFCNSIFEGYLNGNGMFNYINDDFLKKYLKDLSDLEKINIGRAAIQPLLSPKDGRLSLAEAIEKSYKVVLEYINGNSLNLGVSIPNDLKYDFNKYIAQVKENFKVFCASLHQASEHSLRSGELQLPQYTKSIQKQEDNQELPKLQQLIQMLETTTPADVRDFFVFQLQLRLIKGYHNYVKKLGEPAINLGLKFKFNILEFEKLDINNSLTKLLVPKTFVLNTQENTVSVSISVRALKNLVLQAFLEMPDFKTNTRAELRHN